MDRPLLVALDVWLPEGARYPEPDPREHPPPTRMEQLNDDGTVWIPTRPVRRGDRRVKAELYRVKPREPLLCVYTSLERLRASCGRYQAAAAIEGGAIEQIAREAGAHGVAFNPVVAEHAQHTGVVDDGRRDDLFR